MKIKYFNVFKLVAFVFVLFILSSLFLMPRNWFTITLYILAVPAAPFAWQFASDMIDIFNKSFAKKQH